MNDYRTLSTLSNCTIQLQFMYAVAKLLLYTILFAFYLIPQVLLPSYLPHEYEVG